jgi:hypothetical protein
MVERVVLPKEHCQRAAPAVMGRCLAAQPSWGYGVAKKYTRKQRTVRDILLCLLRDGLMGADLLAPSLATVSSHSGGGR